MSTRPTAVAMTTAADRRLGPYVLLAVAGTVAALITGQAGLLAPAVAAAVRVVWGFTDRRAVEMTVRSVDAPARVLEGDEWTLRLKLEWVGTVRVDVLHTGMRGSEIVGTAGWSLTAEGGAVLELDARATGWGRHDRGRIEIRARRPRSMLRADGAVDLPGAVRVLPKASRIDELLEPRRPRVAAGLHVAPERGPGTDLADLRPYVPGDRLRDISWAASARGDQPWVVVRHPERAGVVVLLLDSFTEVGAPPGALDRAARVVWSIAREHLAAGDRVGLVSLGTSLAWLSPVSGRRARWQVLDALLAVGGDLRGSRAGDEGSGGVTSSTESSKGSSKRGSGEPAPRNVPLPTDAVIVGVSPLQSDGFVASLLHYVRLGRPAAVIGVGTDDLAPDAVADDPVERAARRLWLIDVEERRARLSAAGVLSTVVSDDGIRSLRLLSPRRVA